MITRTRFAPSPTGTPESIHLGFIIRALWCYAYAKKNNGQYVLRMEDTDNVRSRPDTEAEIYKILNDFNIKHDEGPDVGGPYGPYKQSERLKTYQEYAHKLVELGAAYYDFDAIKKTKEEIKAQYEDEETLEASKQKPQARYADPKESKERVNKGEEYVIRVKLPENKEFTYFDIFLKKEVSINSNELTDLILLKSDGFPTYHLAVVVDDTLMKISHIFRGVEWISTTPIHLFLFDTLDFERPQIGHFNVIIDPRTGKKFSKRDMSAMFGVKSWLTKGYLKEALLNFLMMLGWAPRDNRELFTLEEFIEAFDFEGIQKANPTFDQKKLDWYQGQYIRQLSIDDLYNQIQNWYKTYAEIKNSDYIFSKENRSKVIEALKLLQERTSTLKDFVDELVLFFTNPQTYQPITDVKELKDKNIPDIKSAVEDLKTTLEIGEHTIWETTIRELAKKYTWKDADMFMLLRISIWGKRTSPPLFETIQQLASDVRIERLNSFLNAIN